MTKICNICGCSKNINEFNQRQVKCKSCHKKYNKEYRENNKERIKETLSLYKIKNKEKLRIMHRNYKAKRKKVDPIFKLRMYTRTRLYCIFKRTSIIKSKSSAKIFGINGTELLLYIESKFKPGMTWENYGQWHIDHIIPLASAKTEEEIYKLCHYTNLQPLWAKDNLAKGAKIVQNT